MLTVTHDVMPRPYKTKSVLKFSTPPYLRSHKYSNRRSTETRSRASRKLVNKYCGRASVATLLASRRRILKNKYLTEINKYLGVFGTKQ